MSSTIVYPRVAGQRYALWSVPQATTSEKLLAYIRRLERECRVDPRSPDLWTCLGLARLKNRDIYQAKAAFEMALQLDPQHFFAHLRSAELYCACGDYASAGSQAEHARAVAKSRSKVAMVRRLSEEIERGRQSVQADCELAAWARPVGFCLAVAATILIAILSS